MADLNSTTVRGNLSSMKIYEDGKALDDKFGTSLSINGNTLSLLSGSGSVLSSATIPSGSATVSMTVGSGIISGSSNNPSITINASVPNFTAGYFSSSGQITTSPYTAYIYAIPVNNGKTLKVEAASGSTTNYSVNAGETWSWVVDSNGNLTIS